MKNSQPNVTAARYFGTLNHAELTHEIAGWRAEWPESGVVALLAEADRQAVAILQGACREAGMPVVGAIFPALIHASDFARQGVWLLFLEKMPPCAMVGGLRLLEDPADAIRQAVERALDNSNAPATLMLIFDAMLPNIGTILEALYLRLADRVGYMGANAGSETFQPMPCLFDGEQLISDGVLCLLLSDQHGAALEHGYLAPDELISATSTEGNRIFSIDWRPAFDVYQERVSALYGVELTRENFYQYGVHFPFGILLANGEVVVRIPVALEQDGSLFCVGEVPANSMLSLLQAPAVDSRHTIENLERQLHAKFGHCDHCDLLTFYCAGRRMHLGNSAWPELDQLLHQTGCARVIGALSLGEIGSQGDSGYPMVHNATLVCRPWPVADTRIP